MRLTETERETIKREAERCFGAGSRVMLLGSRTDDSCRGGDIDLLVRGTWDQARAFDRKIRFLVSLKTRLGDQHIDVVVAAPTDNRPIVRESEREGIVL